MSTRMPVPVLLLVAAGLAAPGPAAEDPAPRELGARSAVVYLVRHAEKASEEDDPGLTPAGRDRAVALAELLAPAGVDRILSSDFRRTRDTAAPLAGALGLEVEIYDPYALEELASDLRSREGETILVVGHSNTTPALVALLGGDPGDPMGEDEYDRLYRLDLPSGRTTVERFEVVSVPVE